MEIRNAAELAESLLADDRARLRHVWSTARVALSLAPAVGEVELQTLGVAAYLHDIGYAPCAVDTGFHPLDGARYLRSQGWPDRLCGLVAYHSAAHIEARRRDLLDVLNEEFARERSVVADALTFCDMTTGPTGNRVTVVERLAEIESRYGPDDLVTRSVGEARDELLCAVERTEQLLAASGASLAYAITGEPLPAR